MNDLVYGAMIIFSEVGVVLLLLFVGLAVYFISKRKKIRFATNKLMQNYVSRRDERKSKLLELLTATCHMDNTPATKITKQLIDRENTLYARLLKIISGKETSSAPLLDRDIQRLTDTYQTMILNHVEGLEHKLHTIEKSNRDHVKKLERLGEQKNFLENDNQRLKDKLAESMKTVEELMGEYTRMYEAKHGEKAPLKEMTSTLSSEHDSDDSINQEFPETMNTDQNQEAS